MIHRKILLIISFITHFFINTTLLISQKNQEDSFDYDQINQEIGEIHKNLQKLAIQYKDKIIDNKLRVPIGLGLHDLLDDNEKYVYRNDAFFYFSEKNTLEKVKILYEQTTLDSLSTEIRITDVMQLSEVVPFPIKVKYISWNIDQEKGDKKSTMNLVRFSDEILSPPGAISTEYSIENMKKPSERFAFLLAYREIIKKLERTMLLYTESRKTNKKTLMKRSLKLGEKTH